MTKKCKYCQSEIDKKAKVCPHCQKKQSNTLGNIVAILVLVFIVIPFTKGFFSAMLRDTNKTATTASTATLSDSGDSEASSDTAESETDALLLYEKDGIKVSYTGLDCNSDKVLIKLLVENDTDTPRLIQTRDTSINGFMVNDIFSCDIAAGKKSNDYIRVYKEELEKNSITAVHDVEFYLSISNANDWRDCFDSDIIKFTID